MENGGGCANGYGYGRGVGCGNGSSNGYGGMIAQQNGEYGLSCGDGAGNGAGCSADPSLWYASLDGLIMGRDRPNGVWTTYETNNNPNETMNTRDARADWSGGYEARIGRRFGCGLWAIEGVYWGLPKLEGFSQSFMPGGSVSTPLIVDGIEFAGVNGTDLFDGAQEHRIWRENSFQNIELNLIRSRLSEQWCTPLDVNALVGVRYFRFDEDLTFGSLDQGYRWGQDGGLHEAYLHDGIENHLLGVQIGVDAGYRMGCDWRLFISPRVGIYNNYIKNRFDLYRGDGVVATPTAASGIVGTYPVFASANQFAFLGQIDVGADWRFAPGWTVFGGYRLIGVTNVGLADNQIPTYVVDIHDSLERVNRNGSLLVHGAFAGLKFEF